MADRAKNLYDKGFFLGSHGVICAMYKLGDLSESKAKQYIGLNRSYTVENENIDIEVRNYAKNYSFTRVNNQCNRLIE